MAVSVTGPNHVAQTGPIPEEREHACENLNNDGRRSAVHRSSFSSIREEGPDSTQVFTSSRTSSYLSLEDHGRDPATRIGHDSDHSKVMAIVQPPSTGLWYPPDHLMAWKQIAVRGRTASKSFSDIKALLMSEAKPQRRRNRYEPGKSPLERLPLEVLGEQRPQLPENKVELILFPMAIGSIVDLLLLDVPPNGLAKRNEDLVALLLVSRRMHSVTLLTLYGKITIPHSRIFQKFLSLVLTRPALGDYVGRIDFSHFNPSQLFSTAAERAQSRNLTSKTLVQCLDQTPNLREFLAQEYIDDDLDEYVLRKLFFGLDKMEALDFCACSATTFRDAFTTVLSSDQLGDLSVRRLCLHKCLTLPQSDLEALLPRLRRLTHLDVASTRLTDSALQSIPKGARLTHLNLAKCAMLSASCVIDFLATHPAATNGLVYLNLATDVRSHQLLNAQDVTALLPLLPKTLKSLNLKGSRMESAHIDLLRPLTKHLEELALGSSLSLAEVNRLFVPEDGYELDSPYERLSSAAHTLRYLDISDMWKSEMDLSFLFGKTCSILASTSEPLKVVELAEDVCARLSKYPAPVQRIGWRTSECGNRAWLVRERSKNGAFRDNGRRGWKMGAESWGMRKIPVAVADVGGMYGSYMFSRKL